MTDSRTRLIALYCVEPTHGEHDSLETCPEPVRAKDCAHCIVNAARVAGDPYSTKLLKVELMHVSASYTLFVTHVTREHRTLGVSEGHMLFAPCNLRQKLVAAPRFNAKTFETLPIDPTMLATMVHSSRTIKANADAEDAAAAARRTT